MLGMVQTARGTDPAPAAPTEKEPVLVAIRREAKAMESLVKTNVARQFLSAAQDLPNVPTRTVFHDEAKTNYYTPAESEKLPESQRAALKSRELDEEFYYTTRYGTPIAYVRAMELLGENGLQDLSRQRILDYGYGAVGHLRMMASLGANVVGVEVDPLLKALYGNPTDQGEITGRGGQIGSLKLVHGSFPNEKNARIAVGEDFHFIIAKNVLKNGYIHPAEYVDPKRLVHLGVDEESFVRMFFRVLKPGGRVLIYNLCPAPAAPGKPYIPWADGRCPFPKEMWERAGFRVLAFDHNDDEAARAMARALGWDKGEGAMDVDNDLFALYTLAEVKVTH